MIEMKIGQNVLQAQEIVRKTDNPSVTFINASGGWEVGSDC